MQKVKFWLLSLAIIIFISFSSYADDLIINADRFSYTEDIIQAEGSVEATYKDIRALGNRLIYSAKDRTIKLDQDFIFFYGDQVFRGKELLFGLDKDKGVGKDVSLQYENVNLQGGLVVFDREEISLNQATFDTCGIGPTPHYHISAQRINLQTKGKWLVAYWGIFWVSGVPTLPMPVYIYDVEAGRKGRENIVPYPEIGSNDEDGLYVDEKVIWYANQNLNGLIHVMYSENKGIGAGLDTNYKLSSDSLGNFWFFGNYYEPFWGGVTHHLHFGPKVNGEPLTLGYFPELTYRNFELETSLLLRERINYERVTKVPEVFIKMKNPEFKIGGGIVSENTGEAIAYANSALDLDYKLVDWNGLILEPGIYLDYSKYNQNGYWFKNIGRLSLSKKWSELFTNSITYSHFFCNDGTSPFKYEQYRFVDNDQLSTSWIFGDNKVLIETVHNLPDFTPQEIDYTVKLTIHCYAIGIRYRAMRNEFNLIFNLL